VWGYNTEREIQLPFEICNEQTGSVADMAAKGWRLTFTRWLDWGGGGCTKLAKTDERYHKSIYKSLLNFT
jgi:hypothetical protein